MNAFVIKKCRSSGVIFSKITLLSLFLLVAVRSWAQTGTETTWAANCSTTPATNLNQMQISQFVNYVGTGYGYVAATASWLPTNSAGGNASVVVAGIPPGATIVAAYLEGVQLEEASPWQCYSSYNVNGVAYSGINIGYANFDEYWNNTAYGVRSLAIGNYYYLCSERINITAAVAATGNGTYTITNNANSNPWGLLTASIVVVYQSLPSTTTTAVQIADGLFGWQTGDGAAPYLWLGDAPEPVSISFCGNSCSNNPVTDKFTRIGGNQIVTDGVTILEGSDTFDVPNTNPPSIILTEPGGPELGDAADAVGGGPSWADLSTYTLPNTVVTTGTNSIEYWMSQALDDNADDNKVTLWLNTLVNSISCNPVVSTPTNTNTATNTNTPTNTHTPTNTNTVTNSPTNTNTVTKTNTNTPTNTPTDTNTVTNSPTDTNTVTVTNTNTSTHTPTNTNTIPNTNTPTNTNTITNTNTPTNTWTNTNTPSFTPTVTNTNTNTNTATDTQQNTATNTNTATSTNTQTNSPTGLNTETNTDTPSFTPTDTNTNTPLNTNTNTATATTTATNTNTLQNTATNTDTATVTNTHTSTATFTATHTNTSTATATNTLINTNTSTATCTASSTPPSVVGLGKIVSNQLVQGGEVISYSIGVTVTGGPSSNLVVTDQLPVNLSFVGFASSNLVQGSYNSSANSLRWVMPSPLAPGIYELIYQAQVATVVLSNSVLVNHAQVTGNGVSLSANAPVTVTGNYNISINIYNEAGEIVRTITIANFSVPIDRITLGPSNLITSLNGPGNSVNIYYGSLLIGVWNGDNNQGVPVTNGNYRVQVDNISPTGVVTSVSQNAVVNRSLSNVTTNIYNSSGERVRTLYDMVGDPTSNLLGLTLSTSTIRPSLSGPASQTGNTNVATIYIQTSGTPVTLVWDATNDGGTVVTPGVYTVEIHWDNGQGQTTDIVREIVVMPGYGTVGQAVAAPNVLDQDHGMSTNFSADGVATVTAIKVNIYTIAGQLVTAISSSTPDVTWDATGRASGLYLAVVQMYDAQGGLVGRQCLKLLVMH